MAVGGLWFLRMPVFVGGFGSFNCIFYSKPKHFLCFLFRQTKTLHKNENSLFKEVEKPYVQNEIKECRHRSSKSAPKATNLALLIPGLIVTQDRYLLARSLNCFFLFFANCSFFGFVLDLCKFNLCAITFP